MDPSDNPAISVLQQTEFSETKDEADRPVC